MRWQDLDSDPNGTRARALRAVRLDRAMRAAPRTGRIETLTNAARGKSVIDLGCVGHSVARVGTPNWLHAEVAKAASSCLGVDLHADGVARMNELGFDAICHDIGADPAVIQERGPFEVVIAGELIEHLEDLGMLLRFARSVLVPGGTLVVTTPNPFAPWRVRAGQLGLITENADHICLVHPSGMAELCDREGVTLQAAWSAERKDIAPRSIASSVWRLLRSTPVRDPRRANWARGLNRNWISPFEVVLSKRRFSRGWCQETAIYVVEMTEPPEPTEAELAAFSFPSGRLFERS